VPLFPNPLLTGGQFMKRGGILAPLLLIVGAARADVIPPGYKQVSHELQINNLNDHADYVLYVYPLHMDFAHAPARFEADKTVSVSGASPLAYQQMRFYAVPKVLYEKAKGRASEDWFDGRNASVLHSQDGPKVYRNTRNSDRTARIVTEYEVTINEGKLTVTRIAEKRYDSDHTEIGAGSTFAEAESLPAAEAAGYERLWYYLGIPGAAAVLIILVFVFRSKPGA
jgi:hypothetical protein